MLRAPKTCAFDHLRLAHSVLMTCWVVVFLFCFYPSLIVSGFPRQDSCCCFQVCTRAPQASDLWSFLASVVLLLVTSVFVSGSAACICFTSPMIPGQGLSTSSLLRIWARHDFAVGSCPVPCGMLTWPMDSTHSVSGATPRL